MVDSHRNLHVLTLSYEQTLYYTVLLNCGVVLCCVALFHTWVNIRQLHKQHNKCVARRLRGHAQSYF